MVMLIKMFLKHKDIIFFVKNIQADVVPGDYEIKAVKCQQSIIDGDDDYHFPIGFDFCIDYDILTKDKDDFLSVTFEEMSE